MFTDFDKDFKNAKMNTNNKNTQLSAFWTVDKNLFSATKRYYLKSAGQS